jgi:hypothetical protein
MKQVLLMICLAAGFSRAAITIDPYLQTPTDSSIYICWQTNGGTESKVQYGTTTALGTEATGSIHQFNTTAIWHWVKLTGLSANTVYYYKCITGTDQTLVKRFRSQPVNGSGQKIRIAIYGDTQSANMHAAFFPWMKSKLHELYGPNLEDSLNLVFSNGDIVGSGENLGEFENNYFDIIAPISGNVPYMVTEGNHERTDKTSYFWDYMKQEDIGSNGGEKLYSFQVGRVLFVSIGTGTYIATATIISWLTGVLNKAEADPAVDWVFLFSHVAPYSEVWGPNNSSGLRSALALCKKYTKPALISSGHTHAYERGAMVDNDFYLMISGGGGNYIDRWGGSNNPQNHPEIQKALDHHHFVVIEIEGTANSFTARMFSKASRTDGSCCPDPLMDTFYLKRTGTSPPVKPAIATVTVETDYAFTLQASAYSGVEEMNSSYFQVTGTKGNYTSPVKNVFRDFEDIYNVDGTGKPIDHNKGVDLTEYSGSGLTQNNTYWARVKYRDKNLQWSEWSEEKEFVLTPGTTDILNPPDKFASKYDRRQLNPVTKFRDLSRGAKIYSLGGQLMGISSILNSGMYLLQTGDGTGFTKIIVVGLSRNYKK